MQTYEVRGKLATLNDHDKANRANRFVGAKMKKDMTDLVTYQLLGKVKITEPCTVSFHWLYSGKHDYDNIRFACKYVLDGMVHAGVLPDDSQKWVRGFGGDTFEKVLKGDEGVIITVDINKDDL
jgi:Holliday junction resolvase RusA-like endonuclease